MRLTRKLNLVFLLLIVTFLFSAVTSGLFFYIQNQRLDETLSGEVLPTIAELKKAESQLNLLLADVEADALEVVANVQLSELRSPDFQVFRKEFILDRLRAANKAKDLNEAKLRELGTAIDGLLADRKETTDRLREAKKGEREEILAAYQKTVAQRHVTIRRVLSQLEAQKQGQLKELNARREQNRVYAILMLGGGLLISVMLLLMGYITLQGGYSTPVAQLLVGMEKRQALQVSSSELGQVASYLNKIHMEIREVEAAIIGIGAGTVDPDVNIQGISPKLQIGLHTLGKRLQDLKDEVVKAERESVQLKSKISAAEAATVETRNALKADIARLEAGLVVAYLDRDFNVVRGSSTYQELTGYTERDLTNRRIQFLDKSPEQLRLPEEIANHCGKGLEWNGEVRISGAQTGGESLLQLHIQKTAEGYLAKGFNLTPYRKQILRLEQNLQTLQGEMAQLKRELDAARQEASRRAIESEQITSQQQELQTLLQQQKQLENRLVQQQSALQELTRNHDLKQGNVREALRFITETAAEALNEDRVGLWLYTDAGEQLRCLDRFERAQVQHSQSLVLLRKDNPALFARLQEDKLFHTANARVSEETSSLNEGYLIPHGVMATMWAPIRLGGNIVGHVLVEHTLTQREWTLDEQNFLMSVADIVSLALEQGNRRAMEEELRITLEEAQALEEELRQNAEEIEATNEEMRRTQVELRGQINALNNSAIVTESNLEGTITYVNNEFLNVYKYSKKEILGKNHRILNSQFHAPSLFQLMWSTILGGKIWKGELRNLTREMEPVWVQTTITPVLGLDHKPYKFISVSFNITSQKKQEEQVKQALDMALKQEELLRENAHALEQTNEEMRRTQLELAGQISALNNASLVFETDMAGKITYVNDALLRTSRYERERLLGMHYGVLSSARQPADLLNDQWNSLTSGRIWHGELEYKTADDKFFWVLATCTPVLDENDEPIKTINVLLDITEQKQQEFRLKRQQNALVQLTGDPLLKDPDNDKAFEIILKSGAENLEVDRVALWTFDESGDRYVAHKRFHRNTHTFDSGQQLELDAYPKFFALLGEERFIASNDAQHDKRLEELVFTRLKGENIHSTLYVPIRSAGSLVGFISFEHLQHRDWELDEQAFAASLADTTGLVMEQKQRLYAEKLQQTYDALEEANRQMMLQKEELEEERNTVMDSIKYAKRIQKNILPSPQELNNYLENYFIVNRPRDVVGGDFHWFAGIDDIRIMIVADGTGHGVPGAFLTLIGYLMLNQIVHEKKIYRPADILYHMHIGIRSALKQDQEESQSRDGMDMAVFMFEQSTLKAQYAGANLPLNLYSDFEIHEIKPDKKSIGGEQMEEERVFHNHELQLKPGDAVYLYTDGFVDQIGGPDDKRFSTRRFRDLILRTQNESMSTQRALLNLEWKEWMGDREQLDDVTLVGIKF